MENKWLMGLKERIKISFVGSQTLKNNDKKRRKRLTKFR